MEKSQILQDIQQHSQWTLVKPVNKGWSSDNKYYIERSDGQKLLLRLSARDQLAVKQQEFAAMQLFWRLGIRMSEPLEFGVCGGGQYVYSLLSWLDGDAADDVILSYTEREQYELGIQAGRILRRIHSLPAPSEQSDWEQRMLRKFENHIAKYRACGIKVQHDELALQYVRDNLGLLQGRPQTLQHGDYHLGNMIICQDGGLGIIDFNRWDYGDPYEEFYKMMIFSREMSMPFAQGQLDGYFAGSAPDFFFRLLALYLADVVLFSVVWAISFGPDEVEGMIKRAGMIIDDYAGFSTHRPAWLSQP